MSNSEIERSFIKTGLKSLCKSNTAGKDDIRRGKSYTTSLLVELIRIHFFWYKIYGGLVVCQ